MNEYIFLINQTFRVSSKWAENGSSNSNFHIKSIFYGEVNLINKLEKS